MKPATLLPLLGLLTVSSTGCVVETLRDPYTRCYAGDACGGGTACVSAMYSLTGAPGTFCSVGCTRGEQCPVSPYYSAYLPTCIVNASVGSGLCYDTCITTADCGGGTVCAQVTGSATVRICVPAS